MFDRRRPIGGYQWQAMWGINYSTRQGGFTSRRRWQWGIALVAIVTALLLMFL